jgi:N-methylhydantoinase A
MRDEAQAIIQSNLDEVSFVEERFAFMRYAGQGHEIKVPIDNSILENQHAVKIKATFEEQYEKLYSRILPNADIEILTWSLSLSIASENNNEFKKLDGFKEIKKNKLVDFVDYERNKQIEIPYFERIDLNPGDLIKGQCIISEDQTTVIVSKNFNTKVLSNNFLQMEFINDN